ncbi:MAG: class I SAM-dependent methyltransferase [Prolixibacteraceae bacterium]|jgi:ubiquinone/menaquinone biosynthesis C-methylase UbiE|nr:class I SAM-dependent methyltransferase [Prolixibacteraceae bacterium]
MNIFTEISTAEEYDSFYQTQQGREVDRIEKVLMQGLMNGTPPGEMLELGCGTGHWTDFFCQKGFQLTAIDESDVMLAIAKKKKLKNAVFQKADASRLPFPDQSFSVIASVTMLEFVENINQVFDEIDRVLKPGGILLIGWLNALSELGKNKQNSHTFRNARLYFPSQIESLLSRFGTPIVNSGVYYSPSFELLDGTEKQNSVHPAFIVTSVQKTKQHGNIR